MSSHGVSHGLMGFEGPGLKNDRENEISNSSRKITRKAINKTAADCPFQSRHVVYNIFSAFFRKKEINFVILSHLCLVRFQVMYNS